jgi:hypothetical protein
MLLYERLDAPINGSDAAAAAAALVAEASAHAAKAPPAAAGTLTRSIVPPRLFREVWRDNLTFAQHQHALHPTFFRFMSDLVVSASRIASTAAARSSHGKELLQSTAELALAFTFETLARVKRDDSKCLTDIIAALCRLLNHTAVVSPVPGSTSVCCAFLSKQLTPLSTNPLRAPLAELLLRTGDSETRGSISRLVVACVRAVVRAAGDDGVPVVRKKK